VRRVVAGLLDAGGEKLGCWKRGRRVRERLQGCDGIPRVIRLPLHEREIETYMLALEIQLGVESESLAEDVDRLVILFECG
jgi:hypothetical protein